MSVSLARPDPVTEETRRAVLRRDVGCRAPWLDSTAGECRDRWGNWVRWSDPVALTLDHVQDGYGRMGVRATSDAQHLVTLCWGHHLGGWATAHRPELRRYLGLP